MPDFTRLEPHVVSEILRVCKVMLVELDASKAMADNLTDTRGFGDFDSAQQLAAGYRRKAAGTPESARERVQQFIDALTHLRDAFATGGEAFLDTEADWARQLAATDPDSGAPNSHQGAQ
ncbi:hypothetical protein MX572_07280 [Rhodococcus pyridinivorans]|uniref:Uncharacterized protein n=1 Tax=Rhodococcus pyridinivorans SB3094 TaxID=1435356 RepID=V9XMW0_9NOCA|nr:MULTISPECIES: hypothetical protein [Rhodococcus]AHD23374.1 hypothetical protein Y013_23585 [Rhodococcus pyridinivorans SB3094]MCT7291970.1 hypothetical protein [Rhodococcus sp. PAE-6]UTM38565.1 hypothetical protein MX572_07280 [Rhodococcus pyridinivorans]